MPGGKEEKVPLDGDAFATSTVFDTHTVGYKWNYASATRTDSKAKC
jgi:hypothetical protein